MKVPPYKKDNLINNKFTTCPLGHFNKQFSLTKIIPVVWNITYESMELIKAKLIYKNKYIDKYSKYNFRRNKQCSGQF